MSGTPISQRISPPSIDLSHVVGGTTGTRRKRSNHNGGLCAEYAHIGMTSRGELARSKRVIATS